MLFALLCALAPAAARAEWRRAVSTHFIVYSEGSDAQLRAAAERLERFDGLLRRLSPGEARPATSRLTVYMPRTMTAVEGLLDRAGVVGVYMPKVAGPFIVSPRQAVSRSFAADTVLFHEYTHHFMLQNFATAYPAWFVEGYAELLSTTRFGEDGSVTIGSFPDHRARELALPPPRLRDLLVEGVRGLSRTDRVAFYGNSWFLTHYLLLSGQRQGELAAYIGLLGQGRPPAEAAEAAFAGGIEGLQRDFYLYRRGSRIPTTIFRFDQLPDVGPITIEALSAGEEALLWEQAIYRRGEMDRGEAQAFARRVRARAAATPRDPAALQLLADAEALAGNYPEATRAVEALLALRPDSPRALMRRGQIEIEQLDAADVTDRARWTAARDWLRRANLADPDDPLILLLYFRAFERQNAGPPPRNAIDGLRRAFELVPQDFDLRGRYADALIRLRRYREAILVLAPIVASAHGGPAVARAERRMAAIAGLGDGAPPPALD